MIWLCAIGGVFLVSLLSFVGAITIFFRESLMRKLVFLLVSLSVGALLGDALIHLIPEALKAEGSSDFVFAFSTFGGFLIFFVLEKFLRWRHSHGVDEECKESLEEHKHEAKPVGIMILLADGLHNIIDGVIIGASFLGGWQIGLATTLAVILHEIPQEIGDFGLLIHSGFSRSKALLWNFFSALLSIVGVIIALLIGGSVEGFIPIMISLAAGGFIYIAASDLVPELHQTKNPRQSLMQIAAIIFGFILMVFLLLIE